MKPLRVLWLIDSLNVGGAENLAGTFFRQIDRSQVDPQLCAIATIGGNPLEKELLRHGVRMTNLQAKNLRDTAAFRRLLALIRDERIELVHAHLTYAAIWAALASWRTGVPSIASLHVAPPSTGAKERLLDRLMRWSVNRWSRRAIAVSEALRQRYLAGGGIASDKFVTVHNGIEFDRFQIDRTTARAALLEETSLPPDAILIMTVSVLRPGKGLEVLIDSMRDIIEEEPRATFLIAGDGPKRQEWRELAAARGVGEHVRWLGHRSDIAAIVPAANLFVLPSLDDAFPTVLLEAMAAGVPAVATKVGGIPEIVSSGETGYLVPPGDPASLSATIRQVLKQDLAAMGATARRVGLQRFSAEAWMNRLIPLYQQVTSEVPLP